jgi:hypothetical protein
MINQMLSAVLFVRVCLLLESVDVPIISCME